MCWIAVRRLLSALWWIVLGFFHACKPAVYASLTLAWGPLQALVALSCLLSRSHLCFSSSPLLPLPCHHPWRQGHSILRSSPCLIQLPFKPAQAEFVWFWTFPHPDSSCFFSSAALSLPSCPPLSSTGTDPTVFCSVAEEDEKCLCESSITVSCKSLQHYHVILNVHGLICLLVFNCSILRLSPSFSVLPFLGNRQASLGGAGDLERWVVPQMFFQLLVLSRSLVDSKASLLNILEQKRTTLTVWPASFFSSGILLPQEVN